jgi:flagella basal body P-ring formation protein FlgA
LTRTSSIIDPDRLTAAAEAVIRAKHSGADIAISRAPTAVVIPAGSAPDLVAEALAGDGIGEAPFRVRVLRDGRELGRALVVLQVAVLGDQVVAVRAISRGALIDAADLRIERLPMRRGIEAVTKPETVIGSLAKLDIAEGAVISSRWIKPRPAVEGGQSVTLVYVHGDFAICAPATAMGSGAIGEQINVRRATDGKTVLATVTKTGEVEIAR